MRPVGGNQKPDAAARDRGWHSPAETLPVMAFSTAVNTWVPGFNNAWYAPYFRRAADVKDGFSTSLMLAERAYGGSRPNTDLRSGYAIGTVNWHNVMTCPP